MRPLARHLIMGRSVPKGSGVIPYSVTEAVILRVTGIRVAQAISTIDPWVTMSVLTGNVAWTGIYILGRLLSWW